MAERWVAEGSPDHVAEVAHSYTGQFLAPLLGGPRYGPSGPTAGGSSTVERLVPELCRAVLAATVAQPSPWCADMGYMTFSLLPAHSEQPTALDRAPSRVVGRQQVEHVPDDFVWMGDGLLPNRDQDVQGVGHTRPSLSLERWGGRCRQSW